MNFCLDLPNRVPLCFGDKLAQLNDSGISLTESGLGLFVIVAVTVFAFILKPTTSRF
jgi:hypothetical protein